jgi:hypothetical protein
VVRPLLPNCGYWNPKAGSLLELDDSNSELNLAFECQNEKHYKVISGFFMTESDVEVNRYSGAIKDLYVKLIRFK